LKQIVVRGIPAEIEREIRREAKGKGMSLNKGLSSLLEETTGVKRKKSDREFLHHDPDHLSGVWTRKDAEKFGERLKVQRKIDEDLR